MNENMKENNNITPPAKRAARVRVRDTGFDEFDPEDAADRIDVLVFEGRRNAEAAMRASVDAQTGADRTAPPLNRSHPPPSFRDAVAYVAAYLERHPTTGNLQFADGRPCFLSESLAQLRKWLDAQTDSESSPQSEPRGEGWSL